MMKESELDISSHPDAYLIEIDHFIYEMHIRLARLAHRQDMYELETSDSVRMNEDLYRELGHFGMIASDQSDQ